MQRDRAEDALHAWRIWRNAVGEDVERFRDAFVTISFREQVIDHALAGDYDPMPDDVAMLLMRVATQDLGTS